MTTSVTSAASVVPTPASRQAEHLSRGVKPNTLTWVDGKGWKIGDPSRVYTAEQLGMKKVPNDPVRDQALLDSTKEILDQIRKDIVSNAQKLKREERSLAEAQQNLAKGGSPDDRGWVTIWRENVARTRETQAGLQTYLFETTARFTPLIETLERTLAAQTSSQSSKPQTA